VLVVRGLLPGRTSALQQEVSALETELPRLRGETNAARTGQPDPATLRKWKQIKNLVDERAFSWTRLLARLEQLMPPGVRVKSISPRARDGRMEIELTAVVQKHDDGVTFLARLQGHKEFDDVYPISVGEVTTSSPGEEGGSHEFKYVMRYEPGPPDATEAAAPAGDTPPELPPDEGEVPADVEPEEGPA
jgi:hypothetical protein